MVTAKMLDKSAQNIEREKAKQIDILYPATGIVLIKLFHMTTEDINKVFQMTNSVWKECRDSGTPILVKAEEETGIEFQLDGDKSYHEIDPLSKPMFNSPYLSDPKEYARGYALNLTLRKYVPTLLQACMCIALHRVKGWGYRPIAKYMTAMNELRAEYGTHSKQYKDEIEKLTGMTFEFVQKPKGERK